MTEFTHTIRREVKVAQYSRTKPLEVVVRMDKDGVYMKPKRARRDGGLETFITWREIARAAGATWL